MEIKKTDRIVITGASGFLGKHLYARLDGSCYQYVIPLSSRDFDLVRKAHVRQMYEKCRPDVVIHLAAVVGGIGANQARPADFFYENIQMGINLIDLAHVYGVKKFIQIGTVCSYPKFTRPPFVESDLWDGYPEETNAPYGIAKKALLVMLQAYRQQYGLNGIYLMPTNLYGHGDNFDLETSHVIPAIIRKIDEAIKNKDDEVVLWGTGRATREFLYVEDCAEGIRLAMEQYNEPRPMNLGSESGEVSIQNLAEMIAQIMHYRGTILFDAAKPDGQPRRALDTCAAKKYLNWEAKTSLVDGLKQTIEYYWANYAQF